VSGVRTRRGRGRAGLPIMHLMHVHGAPGGRGPPEPMALVTIVLSIHLIAAARIAHKFRNWQSVRKLVNRRCFCTTVLALPLSVLVGVTNLLI
jgi:hypothetical protein